MDSCQKVSYLFFFYVHESFDSLFEREILNFFQKKGCLNVYSQEKGTILKFGVLRHFVVFNARCYVSVLTLFKFSVESTGSRLMFFALLSLSSLSRLSQMLIMLFQQFDCVTSEDDHFLVARATRVAKTRLPVVLKSALVSFLPCFFRW